MPDSDGRRSRRIALLLGACALLGLALLAWRWQDAPSSRVDLTLGGDHRNAASRLVESAPDSDASSAPPVIGDTARSPTAADRKDARCWQDRRGQYRALLEGIDPAASANAALDHALLTRVATLAEPDSLPAHQPISSAMSRWPDNVELAWFAYEACSEHAGCDRLQASERLQQVDGDNVFAWLPAMNAARSAGDVDAFAIALHRAATAPVYDPRMGTVFLRLKTLFQHLPLPDSCATSPGLHDTARQSGRPLDASLLVDMEAMALEMAIAMPGLLGVTWCHQQQVALPESLIVDCRRLLEHMADGDTLLEQGLALSLLIELAPNRSDRARWQERYRRLRWLYTFAAEWERIDGGAWRRFAEGEVNVLVGYAKQTGRWPPPDGWLPDDPGSRARIRGE